MAGKYLGDEFDIHGGGPELIFPHHENEIAQSQAAGRPFARYWVHHALVNMGGEKMAKSVGNVVSLPELFTRFRPIEVRYYLAGPHYRSPIDYTPEALSEAATGFRRLENFVQRASERVGRGGNVPVEGARLPAEFRQAMDDDLATPRALGVVHETARLGNQAFSDGDDAVAAQAVADVRAMLDVLGLDPLDEQWQQTASGLRAADQAVDALVELVLQQRETARQRKDYAAADKARDQLSAAGVVVKDTASGTRWSLA
jgi:cysteinyl-tRNA synthetase